jgi:sugar phosphate isomerase/epimerase
MLNRRNFLRTTGAAALGSFALSKMGVSRYDRIEMHPVGLQLFTLFNVMDEDVEGSLKKVADIGYLEIESAFSKKGDFYGLKPGEFAALAKKHGLSWKSHHVLGAPLVLRPGTKLPNGSDGKPIKIPPMLNLRDNMQELVGEIAQAGIPYMVCANIPTHTTDEIKSSIEILNKTNELCKKNNITLAYHNHTEEFEAVDGQVPYHAFLNQLSPDIAMELDLCWATKAGIDPVELFKLHPGRFPLWHVKDLNKERTGPAPVGEGVIDFKRIFDSAQVAGMKHFFVEHDMPADPYASITTSLNNLKKMMQG